MRRGGLKRWSFLITAVTSVCIICALLLSRVFDGKEFQFNLEPDEVIASTRDKYAFGLPITVHAFSGAVLKKGRLIHVLPKDRGYTGSKAQALLDQGNARLALQDADIVIGSPQANSKSLTSDTSHGLISMIVKALKEFNFAELEIHNSNIEIILPGDIRENLSSARLFLRKRNQGVSVVGTALWRGQSIDIDLQAGPLHEGRSHMPVSVSIKSAYGTLQLVGSLMRHDQYVLEGDIKIDVQQLPGLVQLFNLAWPDFAATEKLSLAGPVTWSHGSIVFDHTTVQLDQNEATGALKIRTIAQRPLLSGTLAFDTLNLTPLAASQTENMSLWSGLNSVAAGLWATPVMKLFNADLRLSAKRVQVGNTTLDKAAATLALNDNKLLARLANLNYEGGSGNGQLTIDFNKVFPRTAIRGKMNGVPLDKLSRAIFGWEIIDGPADITADIEATGVSLKSAVASARGHIQISQTQAATVGFNLAPLIGTTAGDPEAPLHDNSAQIAARALKGATTIGELSALIKIKGGTAQCARFHATFDGHVAKCTGNLDLTSQLMDVRLLFHEQEHKTVTNTHAPAQTAKPPAHKVNGKILSLQGPLRHPYLHITTVRGPPQILEHNPKDEFRHRTE